METDPNETEPSGGQDGWFSVELFSVTHSCGVHTIMRNGAKDGGTDGKSVKGLPKQV